MRENYPLFYHLHHSRRSEDIPFWLSLAKQYGGPILELGCGTGRVLAPLAAAGFDVYGLDHSVEMLYFLKSNLTRELSARCHIFEAELSAFRLALEFPLILMPCNTLSMLSKSTRQAALACINHHLGPTGVFAASLPNPVSFYQVPDYGAPELEESLIEPRDGSTIMVSSEWKRYPNWFEVQWHYDHHHLEGGEERLTVAVRHDLALREDYLKEFEFAGLREVASYGNFRKTRYHASSSDLILVARKVSS